MNPHQTDTASLPLEVHPLARCRSSRRFGPPTKGVQIREGRREQWFKRLNSGMPIQVISLQLRRG